MKRIIIYTLLITTSIGLISACGPSDEEIRRREQARQDSLEQVRQQKLEQMRQDSIAQARADSIAATKAQQQKEQENSIESIEFDPNGVYAIQVESWRSEDKAQDRVSTWKKRGFSNAYVVKFGDEETGDVWFRIRLGRVNSQDMAQHLAKILMNKYNEKSWITMTQKAAR